MTPKLWMAGLLLIGAVTSGFAADASKPVAVLNFSVATAETNRWAWAEGGVADLLQIELQQQGLLLLDRDLIHAVLSEQRLAVGGQTAKDQLTLAKLLNAQYLITGRVVPLAGGRFRIEAGAFSVEAIETVVTGTGEGDFPKELSAVLKSVAKQLSTKLSTAGAATDNPVPATAAPKPESLIMFYRGLNACACGQPALGAAYFMNAASLDNEFSVPLLWEIKAYEMAGLTQHAALRRQEIARVLEGSGMEMASQTNTTSLPAMPVLAVLEPVISIKDGSVESSAPGTALTRALLATGQVRVFAFEGIGAAVAEQDLRLSSFFSSQHAPRYGRWLAADGLVRCRVSPAGTDRIALELSLVNPLNASVMARCQRTGPTDALPGLIQTAVGELIDAWTNRAATATATDLVQTPAGAGAEEVDADLRPVYRGLAAAMVQVRREPGTSDSHRALADAFAATGRPRLAAFEIEQCLKQLDIHATNADKTYLGTHRWLFWQPSPASGAAGLVDRRLIDHMIEQLLTTYPRTLAAGCMHYNLSVTAWRAEKWPDAIAQAEQARETLQALIAQYDRKATTGVNRGDMECEMVAATYFLEGSSLGKLGKLEECKLVLKRGLDYMQAFQVRDFCLPLGPYIGDFFGAERVYGYGGDAPGIRTRLEQELAKLGENLARPTAAKPPPGPVAASSAPGSEWIQKGQLEFQNGNYQLSLECYRKAVAAGASVNACPGLPASLLEIALDRNLELSRVEVEKLRRELGFPPVTAAWVEWFAAGRKYQASRHFDFQKAAACYRSALDFLEHPETSGVYHLEKEPHSERVALRWGTTLNEVDLMWSNNYDSRWFSAAFYLAQCLIRLDQKEEAAQWLRRIALKAGGDSIPLLTAASWNSSSYQEVQIGVRAAELLKKLHQDLGSPKFGEVDGPFKVPSTGWKARPVEAPPLPSPEPEILEALTNTLVAAARETRPQIRNARLEAFIGRYGHDSVPAVLSLLPRSGELWDENSLIWLLERTATNSDAPWIVVACTKHWELIALAQRLDPDATAWALAEEWREQGGASFEPPMLIHGIIRARVRPLYALVLEQVAEKRVNHPVVASLMDKVVSEEKSDELEAAFRDALARCLKLKLQLHDYYELQRVSQIALRHGVPEAIDGFLACEGSSPEKLRADLGSVLDLPANDADAIAFLHAGSSRWEWNAVQKKFQPMAQ